MELVARLIGEYGIVTGSIAVFVWLAIKGGKELITLVREYLADQKSREDKFVTLIKEHSEKHEEVLDRVFQINKESMVALNNNSLLVERNTAAIASLEKAVSKIS